MNDISEGKEINDMQDSLKKRIFELAGEKFSISSDDQVMVILFEKLELPIIEKTSYGIPSVAGKVLERLGRDYELPKLIYEFRNSTSGKFIG